MRTPHAPDFVTAILLLTSTGLTSAAPLLSRGLQLRDDTFPVANIGHLRIGTVTLPVTVRDHLAVMLGKIDSGAAERFVPASPIATTEFGGDDPTLSNAALSDEVDQAFNQTAGHTGWVDTYSQFLIDAGQQDNQTLTEQNAIVDKYTDAMVALAKKQAKLLQAYQDANETEVTNIGADIPDSDVPQVDPLTMHKVEEWAKTNGTKSGKVTKKQYSDYLKANQTLAKLKPEYDDLSEANTVAAQGYLFKRVLRSYPGVFNLSMLIAGDPSSEQSQWVPAWTATVINTTVIAGSDATELQGNLQDGLGHDPSSSAAQSSTSSSASTTSTSSSTTSAPSSQQSSADSNGAVSVIGWSTVSARNGIQVAGNYSLTTGHPHRRLTSRNGLHVAGNATLITNGKAQSSPDKTPSRFKSLIAKPLDNASDTGVKAAASNSTNPLEDDPLEGVPDIPLQGNLMLVALKEGSWADNMADYVNYARREYPDIAKQYFGEGSGGGGPIGRHWTHIVLITMNKPNSTELANIQLVGKVWDVLDVLKSNSTAPSTTTLGQV